MVYYELIRQPNKDELGIKKIVIPRYLIYEYSLYSANSCFPWGEDGQFMPCFPQSTGTLLPVVEDFTAVPQYLQTIVSPEQPICFPCGDCQHFSPPKRPTRTGTLFALVEDFSVVPQCLQIMLIYLLWHLCPLVI